MIPPTFLEDGHVATPTGWRTASAACGIKYTGRDDLALVVSDTDCTAAALFTTNSFPSAHIHYDRRVLTNNTMAIRAVLVNTGSANACTGEAGVAVAEATARSTETKLALPADSVLVMSTGVIGAPLPVEKVQKGIDTAIPLLSPDNGKKAAIAIMTTDTYPKYCAVQVTLPDGTLITIGGMAKGSGMIHPNMATMLACITTDAAITPDVLDSMLRYVADRSFHCISVDGDTSTNDTLLLLANGQADNTPITDITSPAGQAFLAGLLRVCQYLAQEVARDGEGASRFVTITVAGAASYAEAHRAAMTIARSTLVKTALFGADPNWGRVLCAIGYSGAQVNNDAVNLRFGGMEVYTNGMPLPFDEDVAHNVLSTTDISIEADLGVGDAQATVWTCDFTYDYIKINAEYRT
jgi:glutamate N-acetyltransferase/amino-acid N-acetyltransferase